MITVDIHQRNEALVGFTVSGHARNVPWGKDIVCAAVSSAAYMTANTVTDILHAPAAVEADDGYMQIVLTEDIPACQSVLQGFLLHMQQMQTQYPKKVHLTITEV